MNVVHSAPRILYCILGPPFTPVVVANKFRGMVNENAITLVIDTEAIVFGKTNSKIMLLKHFPRSVDPFRCPTFLAAEEVNRIGCDADKLNIWELIFKANNLFSG